MKLCIVTRSVFKGDGQGRVNYEIVCEAIRRGYQVTIVSDSLAPDLQQKQNIRWVPILVKRYPTQLLSNMVFSRKVAAWLHKHRSEFDLVQVNGGSTSAIADINTVHFVHSSWLQSPAHIIHQRRDFYGAYQWFYTCVNAFWEKTILRRTKVVLAVSEKVKQELIEINIPENAIHVILNGVDLEEFFPGSGDRQSLNLPLGKPLALFAGDIRTNRKNLDTVLQAMMQVPELHLAVVGNTTGSTYPQLAEKLKLGGRVHFLGYRRDLPDVMRAADFFVFPSRYEPFGMVVTEAMASGLPVIITASAGAAEVVTPDCGIVLPDPEDSGALAQALLYLTQNVDQRKPMGQAARGIAEHHSWSSKAKSYINLFEKLKSPH